MNHFLLVEGSINLNISFESTLKNLKSITREQFVSQPGGFYFTNVIGNCKFRYPKYKPAGIPRKKPNTNDILLLIIYIFISLSI